MTTKMKKIDLKKLLIPIGAVIALIAVILTIVLVATGKESYRLIKINSFEGGIELQREEKGSVEVFKGLQLISADTVAVGEDSFLELLADSDKHIAAEENTGFKLYSSGDEKSGNISIDLLYGKALFTIDNKLNEGSFFQVTSPNATLSVRGTTFSAEYNAEEEKTVAEVMEGTVVVSCDAGAKTLEKGDKVAVIGSGDNVRIEEITDSEYLLTLAKTYPQTEKYTEGKAEHFITVSEYTATAAGIFDTVYSDSEKQGSPLVNPQLMLKGCLDSHAEEVNKYFEENKATAVKSGKATDKDVTEWITDKLTVGGAAFIVDKAYLNISVKGKSSDAYYFTSETHKVRENGRDMYYYSDGVTLTVYGSTEEKPAVTTTAAVTTTTTAPEEKPKENSRLIMQALRRYQQNYGEGTYYINEEPQIFEINALNNEPPDSPLDSMFYGKKINIGENGDAWFKDCFDQLSEVTEAHLSEINEFFEQNYVPIGTGEYEPDGKYEDVTDWYPEEFIIDTPTGKCRFDISCVQMSLFGNAVQFNFLGTAEKIGDSTVTSPVTTTAPVTTTKVTTTAPVTTTKKTTTTTKAKENNSDELVGIGTLSFLKDEQGDFVDSMSLQLYGSVFTALCTNHGYECCNYTCGNFQSSFNGYDNYIATYEGKPYEHFGSKMFTFYKNNLEAYKKIFNGYKKNNFAKALKEKYTKDNGYIGVSSVVDTDSSILTPESPLMFESACGNAKIKIDHIETKIAFDFSEYDYMDEDRRYEFTDPETGKNYYVSDFNIYFYYYGTAEKIN